jgi:hypothetical protein
VVRVTAETDSLFWGSGVDDMALLSLVFDGGAVGGVDPSWSVPAGNPWDYDFFLRIVGTKGSVSVTDLAESVQLVSGSAGGGLRLVPFGVDIDALMVEAFVASIRPGRSSRRAPTASTASAPSRSRWPATRRRPRRRPCRCRSRRRREPRRDPRGRGGVRRGRQRPRHRDRPRRADRGDRPRHPEITDRPSSATARRSSRPA